MLEGATESLEANGDKQKLMETYNNVFCPPARFDFQSHMGDTVRALFFFGGGVILVAHLKIQSISIHARTDGSGVCTAAPGKRAAPEVSAAAVSPLHAEDRERRGQTSWSSL